MIPRKWFLLLAIGFTLTGLSSLADGDPETKERPKSRTDALFGGSDYSNLLGLTKEELKKKLLPPTGETNRRGWRPSKDLTEFTSSGIDSVIKLQVRYTKGRVSRIRELRWNTSSSDRELGQPHIGTWIKASTVAKDGAPSARTKQR